MLRTTDRVAAFTEIGEGKKMGCFPQLQTTNDANSPCACPVRQPDILVDPLVQVRCRQSSQIVDFFETAGDSPAHVFCSGTQRGDKRAMQRAVFSVHCSSLESRELVAIIRSKVQKE